MSGDAYAIAAKGNTVSILNAPSTSDVFLWKSNDNGVNFTKTVIVKSPIELYKENTTMVLDTPYVADGSCAVSIDDNGMVHVAFGITRFFNDVLGDGSSILSGTKESLNSDSLEAAGYKVFHRNDLTGDGGAYYIQNGDFPGYGVAAVSTPQFVLDNGTVYLIYTQILDFPFINTNEGAYYRGVFATKSSDNGNTWGGVSWLSYNKDCYYISDWSWTALQDTDFTISMMTESIYNEGESVFPAVASKIVNGKINMWWQQDYIPGSEIKEKSVSMCQNESSIYHFAIDANQVGIYNNVDEVWQGLWVGISNHNISVFTAENTENGVLSVMNLMGQTVYTMNIDVNEGTNMVTVPVNQLPAGIYMVNIKTNKGISTQKLIVK